jgi:glycosyltransferase involved in cell wall biosynthesis
LGEATAVETYRFTPEDLAPDRRPAGISAFMRVKNGADFIEATVRSHLPYLDEIVVVMNQCSDATPEIVARLAAEYGPERLRAFVYLPKAFAPGSEGHARESADSPLSFVTLSNFALTRTRRRVAMKLDDDHVAMEPRVAAITAAIRRDDCRLADIPCFGGINLARDARGRTGVLAAEPFSGAGDHFYFEVTPETHFIHDARFEDFSHGGKRRRFADFAYWHMKYLKPDFGFANRDIDGGGNPRFARKREAFLAQRAVTTLEALAGSAPWWSKAAPWVPLTEKARLKADRWRRMAEDGPRAADLTALLAREPALL